jgi:hypothetical protein
MRQLSEKHFGYVDSVAFLMATLTLLLFPSSGWAAFVNVQVVSKRRPRHISERMDPRVAVCLPLLGIPILVLVCCRPAHCARRGSQRDGVTKCVRSNLPEPCAGYDSPSCS